MAARIVLLGDREPAYVTHRELDAALDQLPAWAEARWVATDAPEARARDGVDGLWVAPGTPYRDAGAVDAAIGWAREAAGVVVSAHAPDAGVEGIELPEHPFFIATLFQPQVGALAGRPPHPLIGAFLEAVNDRARRGLEAGRSAR
jgi:CTP synthase (UTP-ammonia lyase)